MDTSNYDRQNCFFRTVDGVPVRKIFVSNLPKDATDELLRSLFRTFGPIVSAQVCRRQEEKPNCFGFVAFNSPLEAAAVLKKKFIRHCGRKIFVSAADGWHQPVELPCGKIIWDTRANKVKLTDPSQPGGSGEGVDEIGEDSEEGEGVSLNKEEDNGGEEELEENPEVSDESPVSKLNDDCLLAIFDYLDVKHRVKAGLVCKRWRRIASYFWDSVKQLDFTTPPFHEIPITKGTLTLLIGLCPQVRSVNVSRDRSMINSSTLITIADLCPKLEEIKMRDALLKDRTLIYLARKCPHLKSFSMNASSINHDQEMHSFVKNLKKLHKIHLKYTRHKSGTWLKFLSSPLKSLRLEMYEFEPSDLTEGLQKNNECLEELSFVACSSSLGTQDLETILSLSPNLTTLQVSGSYSHLTPDSLTPVARLKHLTHLDFDNNRVVSDKLIRELVEGCPKLTHLNLSGIESNIFTSKGLSLVVKFPKLTSLRLASLKIVNDGVLKLVAKNLKGLKQLDLMDCASVTDDGCTEILNQCGSLDTMDITRCYHVTNETINAAIKLASNNSLKPRLRIIAGGTGVVDEDWLFEPDVTRRVHVDLDRTFCGEKFRGWDLRQSETDSVSDISFDINEMSDDCDSDDFYYVYDDDDPRYDLLEPENLVDLMYLDHPRIYF